MSDTPYKRALSKRAVMMYSALGHAYFHMFTAFYFVIVLSLEHEWRRPYHELIELWTPGALLVGVFAIAAGWLGDRWSKEGMLVVYFLGMGASAIAAAYATHPSALLLALAGLGLFAAIYHPIGIPLVIRNSGPKQGWALAFNGVFGSLGAAMAGLVTGALADVGGSFLAFALPGVVVMATGVGMWVGLRGAAPGGDGDGAADDATPSGGGGDWRTPLLVLMFCLTAAGLIYHATQTVMPKSFSLRLGADGGLKTVGAYVALVYTAGGLFQFVGGALADRYNLKLVYLAQFALHGALLAVAAWAGGLLLVAVLMVAVSLGAGALPAENMLLARYIPRRRHGLVFGVKFVLFFGSAPLAVMLVSAVGRRSEHFGGVFLALALAAAIICAVALALPRNPPALQTAR